MPDLALGDHLGHHQVRDPARQRAAGRAREGPVEVPTVGQVALAGHHAEHVQDRYGDQGPAHLLRREGREQPADDLDPDDLVAVRRRVDPHHRPVLAAVQDPDREPDVGAGDQPGDRELEVARGARPDPHRPDGERVARHQRPRLRRRTEIFGPPAEVGAARVDDEALPQGLAADQHPEAHLVALRQRHLRGDRPADQADGHLHDVPLGLVARRAAHDAAVVDPGSPPWWRPRGSPARDGSSSAPRPRRRARTRRCRRRGSPRCGRRCRAWPSPTGRRSPGG